MPAAARPIIHPRKRQETHFLVPEKLFANTTAAMKKKFEFVASSDPERSGRRPFSSRHACRRCGPVLDQTDPAAGLRNSVRRFLRDLPAGRQNTRIRARMGFELTARAIGGSAVTNGRAARVLRHGPKSRRRRVPLAVTGAPAASPGAMQWPPPRALPSVRWPRQPVG